MATILYLSNQLVQAAEAKEKNNKIKIHEVFQEQAPEGSIINGIITDEEAFSSWIKVFFSKNRLPKKEVMLVVSSTQFNHKVLELPGGKISEIRKMISREFSESRTENTLFTYQTMEKDAIHKKMKILATAVEKEVLLSYISFFRQAGIEIISVNSGVGCMAELLMAAPEIQKKTCIIQVLDGQEMISMLFVKGNYYYAQRNRLFSLEKTEKLAEEMGAVTDRLLQFATSQQIKEPVEAWYICGKGQNEVKSAFENGDYSKNLRPRSFTGEGIISIRKNRQKGKTDFIYPAGCLLQENRKHSLYKQLKQESKGNQKKRELFRLILPGAVTLGICLIITVLLGNGYLSKSSELQKLERMMQEEETVRAYAGYQLSTASIQAMEEKISVVEQTWDHLMSYPALNTSVEQVLKECAGSNAFMELTSFHRDSGVLTLNAWAKTALQVSQFIDRLQSQELFESVEYSGYTYDEENSSYSIHVICCLAEGAGR